MGDRSAGSEDVGLRFQQAESQGAGLLLGDQASLPSNRGITGHASALDYLEGTAWSPGTLVLGDQPPSPQGHLPVP